MRRPVASRTWCRARSRRRSKRSCRRSRVRAFRALACRDFARADFRLDAAGRPVFLELNPLPTFARDGSFAVLAEILGRTFEDLLAEVLALGLQRLELT